MEASVNPKLSGSSSLLVSVTVLVALVVPTTCAGKDRVVGKMVSGDVPVPWRLSTCGLVEASSFT